MQAVKITPHIYQGKRSHLKPVPVKLVHHKPPWCGHGKLFWGSYTPVCLETMSIKLVRTGGLGGWSMQAFPEFLKVFHECLVWRLVFVYKTCFFTQPDNKMFCRWSSLRTTVTSTWGQAGTLFPWCTTCRSLLPSGKWTGWRSRFPPFCWHRWEARASEKNVSRLECIAPCLD